MIGLAFDTETTGLIDNATLPLAKQPEIIELYMCLFDNKDGETKSDLNVLIKPRKAITEEITTITGIDNEMVENKKPFFAHANDILKMISKAKFMTGHNLSYDLEMIEFEFKRINKDMPDWNGTLWCTVEQTVHLKGIRLSLSALHEYLFGEPFAGAHRAKQDVQAQIRCYMELKKRGEL